MHERDAVRRIKSVVERLGLDELHFCEEKELKEDLNCEERGRRGQREGVQTAIG